MNEWAPVEVKRRSFSMIREFVADTDHRVKIELATAPSSTFPW